MFEPPVPRCPNPRTGAPDARAGPGPGREAALFNPRKAVWNGCRPAAFGVSGVQQPTRGAQETAPNFKRVEELRWAAREQRGHLVTNAARQAELLAGRDPTVASLPVAARGEDVHVGKATGGDEGVPAEVHVALAQGGALLRPRSLLAAEVVDELLCACELGSRMSCSASWNGATSKGFKTVEGLISGAAKGFKQSGTAS
eukprot:2877292-Alexandrium_andersonii.AAC.1